MSQNQQLKFHPVQSFVDSSFFTHLSQKKLTEYKLDAVPKDIHGFMPRATKLHKFIDKPVINLDYNCFGNGESDELTSVVDGRLYNVNTIEEFKALDKKQLLHDWGQELLSGIKKGEIVEKFYLISFSDLKKYRFYYWLAYPIIHTPWFVKGSTKEPDYPSELEEYLEKSNVAFFQIKKDQSGLTVETKDFSPGGSFVYVDTCLNNDGNPSVQLKNYLSLLAFKGFKNIDLIVLRKDKLSTGFELELDPTFDPQSEPFITGWERTAQGKLGPKMADLGSLIDPHSLADQAVDLNLNLMKWRVAPQLNLDVIKSQKVLLLGAGTLGSYVSRALMGWGVREINFIDNGRVSYSNPVRQPLFTFKDCFADSNRGLPKATRASEALKEIFPGVTSTGYDMEVPMIGHPVSDISETDVKQNFETLQKLFAEHDSIFLLMDSRESRWLPTLMGAAMNKTVINAALGFDSYLVLRHSPHDMEDRLGCYYCNDVVAPTDSLSDRSLDQMCTVTRPGGALVASSLAVEVFVSLLQHELRNKAPHNGKSTIGEVPHQIRGFLHNFTQTKLTTPAYKHCSACCEAVIEKFREDKWEFVKRCLNSSEYLEQVSGLTKVQEEAEKAAAEMMEDSSFSDEEYEE